MIYEMKKKAKRRFSRMHSIKMTPSWLFPHAKCKRHFSILIYKCKKKKKKNPCKPRIFKNVFKVRNTNSFLYEIEM
jgi:hypothetical protein